MTASPVRHDYTGTATIAREYSLPVSASMVWTGRDEALTVDFNAELMERDSQATRFCGSL